MAHYWPGSIQKQLILYDASIKPPNIEKVKEFCAFVEGILYGERSHQTAVASDIAPTIVEIQAAGATSLRGIAAELNERGIPTARGGGTWSAAQVARVLDRL
jgi:hypothetical protein